MICKNPFVLLVLELPTPEAFGLIVATSNAKASREGSCGCTGAPCGIAEPDRLIVNAPRMHACLIQFIFPRILAQSRLEPQALMRPITAC